jgi:hypothetical protein
MTAAQSYLYHASAHAFSGHLVRPENQLIPVQAGVMLPSVGGQHTSRVENFRHGEAFSFAAGYAQVCGGEKIENGKIIHTTLATATVEKLNFLNVITADRIVARLGSSFEPGNAESRILLIGSYFENLRVAGCKVEVELHHELALKLDTFENTIKQFKNNTEFKKMAEDPFNPGHLPSKIEPNGILRCSMVQEVQLAKCPGITQLGHHGHVLVVPEFGKIFLAEVLFSHARKRITMLRVELGSPQSGGGSAGDADSNGRPPS